jgi:hypothetical protein
MVLRTLRIGPIVLIGLLSALAGCSGRGAQKGVFAVSGKLTYQGQPMDHAQITFRLVNDPNPKALGKLARADANGVYKATSYHRFDGLPAGEYVVTIQWPEARGNNGGSQEVATEEDLPPDRLQGTYADPMSSQLRATVAPKSNQIDFALP